MPETFQEEQISIRGMRCSACVQLIELRLRALPGVILFTVNLVSHRATIRWDGDLINLSKIIQTINELGYQAFPFGVKDDQEKQEKKKEWWRLFVASFAMMQVMMYAFPAYFYPVAEVNGDLTPDIDFLLKWASLVMTIPVVLFSSRPFFEGAWRDIRNRHIGMDVPVAVGIIATFIASVLATLKGGAVYYDSLIMFVLFLLIARTIEARVHRKSTAALRSLIQLTPALAEKLEDYPHSQQRKKVNVSDIKVEDHVWISVGDSVPVDGVIVNGQSACDESWMTGESRAVSKKVGDKVVGGALNLISPLVVRVEKVGNDTQLSTLIKMMEVAANEKPPLLALADRYASRFLTVILILSVITFFVWLEIDARRAIEIAIAVLVVTCPCALSLATPGVMSGAIGALAQRGMLIARARAVESLTRVTHVIFDKTGTLTEGKLLLHETRLVSANKEWNSENVLMYAANLAKVSLHPASLALVNTLKLSKETEIIFENVQEIVGQGISAQRGGEEYRLGNFSFVAELSNRDPLLTSKEVFTIVALGNTKELIALFFLKDALREDAIDLVSSLQKKGKQVIILSGDNSVLVDSIGAQLKVDQAIGQCSPDKKRDIVQSIQKSGGVVAMVGDGMNDGPVLSLSDVSIVMGNGAPISQATSDMILVSNRLKEIGAAFSFTTKAMRLIWQNILWALIYNVVAIPSAVMGILVPWHAAVGMSVSSMIVVLNSLRILSKKDK
jgi:Cu2+-exporting ATPase